MSGTVVRVVAVEHDRARQECCDETTGHVWVRVLDWSTSRAFLTGAGPFVAATGRPAAELAGRTFLAAQSVAAAGPPGDHGCGELLEWPGLTLVPKVPPQAGADEHQAPVLAAASLLPAGGREADQEHARLLAGALAPGVADYTVVTWSGTPASKARHRTTKDGRTYKTDADEAAETKTGWHLRRAFRTPLAGNLALGAVFFRPDRQRVDADNMLKHVCDAGNKIAWADDAQITATYGVVELDAQFPRTLLVVVRHVSSLDRTEPKRRAPRRRPGGRS